MAPPMQPPWIEQTTGLVISSQMFQASSTSRRKARRFCGSSASAPSAPKSMPEENIGPAPRTTTQSTSGSAAAARKAAPSAWTSSPFIALRFSGRSRTTWRTGPRSSVVTIDMAATLPPGAAPGVAEP